MAFKGAPTTRHSREIFFPFLIGHPMPTERDFLMSQIKQMELRIHELLNAVAGCQDSREAIGQMIAPVSTYGARASHLGFQCNRLRQHFTERLSGEESNLRLGKFSEIDIALALADAVMLQSCAISPAMQELGDALVKTFATLAAGAICLLSAKVRGQSHRSN